MTTISLDNGLRLVGVRPMGMDDPAVSWRSEADETPRAPRRVIRRVVRPGSRREFRHLAWWLLLGVLVLLTTFCLGYTACLSDLQKGLVP